MKLKIVLMFIMVCLLASPVIGGVITYDGIFFPIDFTRTSEKQILFKWNATSSVSLTMISTLFITNISNENQLLFNKTNTTCANATQCSLEVTGFVNRFFQWEVTTTDNNGTDNFSSGTRWVEIYNEGIEGNHTFFRWFNDSGNEAMNLNKDNGDLNVFGNLNATKNVTIGGFLNMTNGSITNVNNISLRPGGLIKFGPGTSPRIIDNTGNVLLLSSSRLFLDAASGIFLGTTTNDPIILNDGGATVMTAGGDLRNHLIISTRTNTILGRSHDVPASPNPLLAIFSAEDPDTDNQQYGWFSHNQTDFIISTRTGDVVINNTLLVTSNATFGDDINLTGNNITNVDSIIGNLNPVKIGDAGVTSHSLDADDDLLVTGELEVNGVSFFDNQLTMGNTLFMSAAIKITGGANVGSIDVSSTTQNPVAAGLWTGTSANLWIFGEDGDRAFNFAHPKQTDPTMFFHSNATDTTKWLSITYKNATNEGLISTGNGSLRFDPYGPFINFSSKNLTSIDQITANNISGTLYWNNLTNFPAPCPAGSSVTENGDSNTCTSFNNVYNSSSWNKTGSTVHLGTTSDSVGIGTTSPDSKLHVIGGGVATSKYPNITSSGDIVAIFENGNQQIEFGTVRGTNDRRAWILARHSNVITNGGFFSTLHLQPDIDGNENDYEGVAIAYNTSFKLDSSTGLAVGKDVLIGTLTPSATLTINSSDGGGSLRIYNTTGNQHLFVNGSTGNVGIGTISPDSKLRVVGNANITDILTLGSSVAPRNLTMYSPAGTRFNCGVGNDGAWTCQ